MSQKCLLIIMDGWGLGQASDNNAIFMAQTPFVDSLFENYPHSELMACGEDVGLPAGQMGNSEVGHLNIGAGRVVFQELLKINKSLADDAYLDHNRTIQEMISYAEKNQKPINLMGLVSDGGVHSHISHLISLVNYLDKKTSQDINIHAFTDGRDTDPKSGLGFLRTLIENVSHTRARLATIIGRYYAMDRDKRWDRVALAYQALVEGKGELVSDWQSAIERRYEEGESDEFLKPIIISDSDRPLAIIEDNDVVMCFNFRTDRCREITEVLSQKDFPEYGMTHFNDLFYVTMTEYDKTFKNVNVVFQNEDVSHTLGEVISGNGLTQIRIAETEKYPHVTFFFSGGREVPFDGETRQMLQSPKDVATYDLKPEMSAREITNTIIPEIQKKAVDFIALNFANTDMVGHTGNFAAAMKAAETVDQCVSEIVPVALANDYCVMITADHGNSDFMVNADGSPNTAHSLNPVPFFVLGLDYPFTLSDGRLADIAPTILYVMNLPVPVQMSGKVLIQPI